MMNLDNLQTPALLIDEQKMRRNIERMQSRMQSLGVAFRPHVKTSKCAEVARLQRDAGAQGITVSTLKEAEEFFNAGFDDILYAVAMVPGKANRAFALQQRGCNLKLVVDSMAGADAVLAASQRAGVQAQVMLEVDVDGHRSGLMPGSDLLIAIGRRLHEGGARLRGVMAHAGSSYDCSTPQALQAIAEQERSRSVEAAKALRQAGLPCDIVSIGSTPTALSAQHLEGITEVRAGVYVFFDLVMAGTGVCSLGDIALSVLTTVIGHQAERGWVMIDAGWMAMSRDRGTQKQAVDHGYGVVCRADGTVLEGWRFSDANQEHGIIAATSDSHGDIEALLPMGTQLRILPNHACATGAQHAGYENVSGDRVLGSWPRFSGW